MNATERAALLGSVELYDEMHSIVDDRTLEILERRRKTAIVRRRGWLVRRMLLGADLLGLVAAFFLAELIVTFHRNAGVIDARTEAVAFTATLPLWVVIAKLYGLYERDEERADHSTADDFSGVFHMVTVCTWTFAALAYLTSVLHPTAGKLVIFWAAAIAFVTAGRAAARAIARRSPLYLQNTVIVGAGDVGQLIAKKLLQHREYGINIVGFVDSEPKERRCDLEHLTLLGDTDRLPAIIRLFDVERVIVAASGDSTEEAVDLVHALKQFDVQIDVVPRLFEVIGHNVGFHSVEGIPLLGLPPFELSRSSRFLKRFLDIALACLGLAILSPFFAALAIAIKVDSRGPILYRHRRVGQGGRPIDVLKFRTMRREACRGERYGGHGAEAEFARLISEPARAAEFGTKHKFRDDPRVTRLGKILRASSIDELPQLVNVLRGDLSLVGPRPITHDELDRYGDKSQTLLNIRPGVTGYWQISGRSDLDYVDRVRLDLAYVGGWTLGLDLKILARTARVLVLARGAR